MHDCESTRTWDEPDSIEGLVDGDADVGAGACPVEEYPVEVEPGFARLGFAL